MKRKDIDIIKSASPAELSKNLKETKDRLRTATFEYQAGKLQNAKDVRELRRTVARILTFMRQKEA